MSKNNQSITYLTLLAFIILVMAACELALTSIKSQTERNIKNSLHAVLNTIEEAHRTLINQRKITLQNIAALPNVIIQTESLLEYHEQSLPLKRQAQQLELRSQLKPIIERYQDKGYFVIAPDSINIAAMRDSTIGKFNVIADLHPTRLEQAFDGETVLVPAIPSDIPLLNERGYVDNTPLSMFLLAPIQSKSGSVIAVLALRLDPLKHFEKVTNLGRIGDTGETYIFNQNGYLLTQSRFEQQLLNLNLINHANANQKFRIADPGGDLTQGYLPKNPLSELPLTEMAYDATQERSGFNLKGYRDYRGVPVVGAWHWNKEFDFGITSEIDYKEAFSPYFKTRNTLLTVIVVVALSGIIFAVFVRRLQGRHEKQLVKANNLLEEKVNERTKALKKANDKIEKANKELQVLATTDSLTGLANRRDFDKHLREEWLRCQREQVYIGIVVLDIDYFKQYNDFYGHLQGDDCLKRIGSLLTRLNVTKRPGDVTARYGGEEFVILLSNTSLEYLQQTANLIRSSLESMAIPHMETKVVGKKVVTASLGYNIIKPSAHNVPQGFVEQADQALYNAKSLGRNRVYMYDSDKTPVLDNYRAKN